MSNDLDKLNLSPELKASMIHHEALLHFIAGFDNSKIRSEARKTADIANDIVINGALGKTIQWRDALHTHLTNPKPFDSTSDTFTVIEDLSVVIGPEQAQRYMDEVNKIRRHQAKAERLGYRRIKALKLKAARKGKKQAKRKS